MNMENDPILNGPIGRGKDGKFGRGNPGGPGNPYIRQIAKFRAELLVTVTINDLQEIIKTLIEKAKAGDIQAAKIILDRIFGPPQSIDIMEKLNELEEIVTELNKGKTV
ncbi:MAG: hypothetical protein PHQ27_07025 [Victivallales bacterium]|nr:hypothetical protein [Victivallales bacterium]